MTFVPNEKEVAATAERMITTIRPGGYRYTLDDACWWAWEHAFSYDMHENGHKFWRAVYDTLNAKRKLPTGNGSLTREGN